MGKIAVMGAAGQLGSRIVRQLSAQGHPASETVAAVRSPEKAADLAAQGFLVRRADYEDGDSLETAFRGCGTVLLVPSFAPVESRIGQHARAIEAARRAAVERLVFSSFIASHTESPFIITPFLAYAESALGVSGLRWTILRNGMYSDPLVPYLREIVEMGHIPYPAGEGRISYVSRDDLARASAAALLDDGHAGRAYDLTGPEALSIDKLAGIVTRVTGKPVRYEPASDEEFAEMCREPGIPDYVPWALVTIYHAAAEGFLAPVSYDIERLTGTPSEELESFLRRNYESE